MIHSDYQICSRFLEMERRNNKSVDVVKRKTGGTVNKRNSKLLEREDIIIRPQEAGLNRSYSVVEKGNSGQERLDESNRRYSSLERVQGKGFERNMPTDQQKRRSLDGRNSVKFEDEEVFRYDVVEGGVNNRNSYAEDRERRYSREGVDVRQSPKRYSRGEEIGARQSPKRYSQGEEVNIRQSPKRFSRSDDMDIQNSPSRRRDSSLSRSRESLRSLNTYQIVLADPGGSPSKMQGQLYAVDSRMSPGVSRRTLATPIIPGKEKIRMPRQGPLGRVESKVRSQLRNLKSKLK